MHTPTAESTMQGDSQLRVRHLAKGQGHHDTQLGGAGDRTGDLAVTSPPALPPELTGGFLLTRLRPPDSPDGGGGALQRADGGEGDETAAGGPEERQEAPALPTHQGTASTHTPRTASPSTDPTI